MNYYNELISKLDGFIRKFYLNQMLRGALLFTGLVLILFITFSYLEYNFYFEKAIRKVLFYGFCGISLVSAYFWIFAPVSKYFKLGKVISHEHAAEIIGSFFTNVQDKLLNILQLKAQANAVMGSDLVLAGIDQKTQELRPVNFQKAIDLGKNKRFLQFALPPLAILLAVMFLAPYIITEGSSRIIQNDKEFERPAPFSFAMNSASSLQAIQYKDFPIQINTSGDALPAEVFVEINGKSYQMQRDELDEFSYVIKGIRQPLDIKFFSGEVKSNTYHIDVIKHPEIEDLQVLAYYPRYLNRSPESFENIGDLRVPVGTNLTWNIKGKNTSEIQFASPAKVVEFEKKENESFTYKQRALRAIDYKLIISSPDLHHADSVSYVIETIRDKHPVLNVEKFVDSTDLNYVLYNGKGEDDYGLSQLDFVYQYIGQNGKPSQENRKTLKSNMGFLTSFDHLVNLDSFNIPAGDKLHYFFELWDNDGVNGRKSVRSAIFTHKTLSAEEIQAKVDKNRSDIEDTFKKNLSETQKLQDQIKALKEKFLAKKELNWQDKKELEALKEQQEELMKKLEEARDKLQENKENQKEPQTPAQEQKQEKIEESLDELIDDQMKELMEQIQEMMEKLNRDESLDQLDEMESEAESMEMNLDKMQELFKQLEVETELQEKIDELKELAEKQEKLAEETDPSAKENEENEENEEGEEDKKGDKEGDNKEGENKEDDQKGDKKEEQDSGEKEEGKKDGGDSKKSDEELKKEQEKLKEEFEKLQEELEDLKKKNEELEIPKNIEDTEEEEESIEEEQQKSSDKLSEGDKQKSSKSQKKAAKKMKKMAEQLESGMQGGAQDQMGEDMQTMRQLLENILTLSFDEEELVDEIAVTNHHTENYVLQVQEQHKIKDDFTIVRDSLHALSKRVMQIESFVMEKATDIDKDLTKSLKLLEDRKKQAAVTPQRFVMKNLNDLALMLAESMAQMQQQMSSMMSGSQMCNKPNSSGKGKKPVPMDKITEGQQKLQSKMQGKSKQQQNSGSAPTAEEFAKMAQEQGALRKALRDAQKEGGESGQNSKLLQEIMDAMNQVEKDLVNKKLNNETMKRQQDILTRLLKAEKAEREREYDEKREAEKATDIVRKLPPAIEEYLKKQNKQIQDIDRTIPGLTPYFKTLVEKYYQSIEK